MWTREKAERWRALLKKSTALLSDAEASEMPTMFSRWEDYPEGYKFTAEDVANRLRVYYAGELWAITQPHDKQAGWAPDVAVSLYERILYQNGYREIGECITAENPFSEGEEGIDADGVVWVSLCDNNVCTPAQYPGNWERKEMAL